MDPKSVKSVVKNLAQNMHAAIAQPRITQIPPMDPKSVPSVKSVVKNRIEKMSELIHKELSEAIIGAAQQPLSGSCSIPIEVDPFHLERLWIALEELL